MFLQKYKYHLLGGAATRLRRELMDNDLQLVRKRTANTVNRRENLIVRAPMNGQLSFLNVTLEQRVGQSESIGEIKVMDNFKIHTRLSEYYIDRVVTTGYANFGDVEELVIK